MPEDKRRARTETEPPDPESFVPFADNAGVRSVGALSFENGTDRVVLHGSST
ncbi:hypothetical protein ACU4GR_06975 [Methylobacterium oryzae CBMB20]